MIKMQTSLVATRVSQSIKVILLLVDHIPLVQETPVFSPYVVLAGPPNRKYMLLVRHREKRAVVTWVLNVVVTSCADGDISPIYLMLRRRAAQ